MDQLQTFIHRSRYSRWLPNLGRREFWDETVDRYLDFFAEHLDRNHAYTVGQGLRSEVFEAIHGLNVLPSMRALMTAGPALERSGICSYNCSYLPIDHWVAFDEAMTILLHGTGVGFSVERRFVNQLPKIADTFSNYPETIVVADSKEGWGYGFRHLLSLLWQGLVPKWDLSEIRPAGAPLKTFGGRASGPEPLNGLFHFAVELFWNAAGRRLTSLECHDLVCKAAEIVVVGGVRRCLPVNYKVFTEQGVKEIKDVKSGDFIVTGGMKAKVLASESSGVKGLLRIKHRFGELVCTPEHRVAYFASPDHYEFKPASEIQVGDRLVWDGYGIDGTETTLPPFNEDMHFNSKEFIIPDLDEDVAWLFGLIHGNGHVAPRILSITQHVDDLEVLELANRILSEKFGLAGRVGPDGRGGNCALLRTNSAPFCRWLLNHLKQPNTPLVIPDFIMNGSRGIRGAYLAGLFDSDGRSRSDGVIEQATTVYSNYAEQIVTALATLGIGCVSHQFSAQRRRDEGGKNQDYTTINIKGTMNRTRWVSDVLSYSRSIKGSGIEVKGGPCDYSFPVSMYGRIPGYKNSSNITASALEMSPNDFLPTPVLSVEEAGEDESWDIEVESLQQFTANGLVVHNSALISLSDLDDDLMRNAKSGEWWVSHKHRALANNSACYNSAPARGAFDDEWKALIASQSGERGIFNRAAAHDKMRSIDRYPHPDVGTNPCVIGETELLTSKGYIPIGSLVGQEVEIWNGEQWSTVTPFSTGRNPIMQVDLSNGATIYCTPYHKFIPLFRYKGTEEHVQARDLTPGQMLFNFQMPKGVEAEPNLIEVMSVRNLNCIEKTFCVTEPISHRMTVNGIVTGQCGEILLRPSQMCNLSNCIMRSSDQLPDMVQKVKLASLLGTWQATLTDLPYLRPIWAKNTKEERLLGVGMAGILDAGLDQAPAETLKLLRDEVWDQNEKTAAQLGIPTTAAATCVKPDGNSSQLVNCSSGIHPRHSRFYIRTIRQDWKDPLTQYMVDAGFPHEPCVFQGDTTAVFSFPVESPDGAMVRDELGPIEHLEIWKHFRENWTDHNPSITVSVGNTQWGEVGDWVYDNFDQVCGVSFLPKTDHVYQQAPYQEITEEEYWKAVSEMPGEVDWSNLRFYENSDQTEGVQQLACVAGVCEI